MYIICTYYALCMYCVLYALWTRFMQWNKWNTICIHPLLQLPHFACPHLLFTLIPTLIFKITIFYNKTIRTPTTLTTFTHTRTIYSLPAYPYPHTHTFQTFKEAGLKKATIVWKGLNKFVDTESGPKQVRSTYCVLLNVLVYMYTHV
jgi:hypothetical protein